MGRLLILPCLDSPELAAAHRAELTLDRERAAALGAWGCGAFANDPKSTGQDFRAALEGEFGGSFREVIFAIADWSPERRYLGPFRDEFSREAD